jgi:hypothetical protein
LYGGSGGLASTEKHRYASLGLYCAVLNRLPLGYGGG